METTTFSDEARKINTAMCVAVLRNENVGGVAAHRLSVPKGPFSHTHVHYKLRWHLPTVSWKVIAMTSPISSRREEAETLISLYE